ncbi:MAG TPA: 16S rRNA (guanine(966)-N(2))-methyltransferase RsmD [Frankiaceae bacterium]|nr:16S rRNA (guanine(966)-N(2))-methyltransferase RsmD [Frankiaceae bacterium]
MRIVAGAAKGRPLVAPTGRDTRPTSDRAREGLFSTLATLVDLDGARVLDLYAGSGAVGLEALSRGAAHAVLVESDLKAANVIRRNVDAVGLPGARVVVDRVERFLASDGGTYDVAFLDPPYDTSEEIVARVLAALRAEVVVVERATRGGPVTWPAGVEGVRERRYGEGTLWYGRRVEPAS